MPPLLWLVLAGIGLAAGRVDECLEGTDPYALCEGSKQRCIDKDQDQVGGWVCACPPPSEVEAPLAVVSDCENSWSDRTAFAVGAAGIVAAVTLNPATAAHAGRFALIDVMTCQERSATRYNASDASMAPYPWLLHPTGARIGAQGEAGYFIGAVVCNVCVVAAAALLLLAGRVLRVCRQDGYIAAPVVLFLPGIAHAGVMLVTHPAGSPDRVLALFVGAAALCTSVFIPAWVGKAVLASGSFKAAVVEDRPADGAGGVGCDADVASNLSPPMSEVDTLRPRDGEHDLTAPLSAHAPYAFAAGPPREPALMRGVRRAARALRWCTVGDRMWVAQSTCSFFLDCHYGWFCLYRAAARAWVLVEMAVLVLLSGLAAGGGPMDGPPKEAWYSTCYTRNCVALAVLGLQFVAVVGARPHLTLWENACGGAFLGVCAAAAATLALHGHAEDQQETHAAEHVVWLVNAGCVALVLKAIVDMLVYAVWGRARRARAHDVVADELEEPCAMPVPQPPPQRAAGLLEAHTPDTSISSLRDAPAEALPNPLLPPHPPALKAAVPALTPPGPGLTPRSSHRSVGSGAEPSPPRQTRLVGRRRAPTHGNNTPPDTPGPRPIVGESPGTGPVRGERRGLGTPCVNTFGRGASPTGAGGPLLRVARRESSADAASGGTATAASGSDSRNTPTAFQFPSHSLTTAASATAVTSVKSLGPAPLAVPLTPLDPLHMRRPEDAPGVLVLDDRNGGQRSALAPQSPAKPTPTLGALERPGAAQPPPLAPARGKAAPHLSFGGKPAATARPASSSPYGLGTPPESWVLDDDMESENETVAVEPAAEERDTAAEGAPVVSFRLSSPGCLRKGHAARHLTLSQSPRARAKPMLAGLTAGIQRSGAPAVGKPSGSPTRSSPTAPAAGGDAWLGALLLPDRDPPAAGDPLLSSGKRVVPRYPSAEPAGSTPASGSFLLSSTKSLRAVASLLPATPTSRRAQSPRGGRVMHC